MLCDEREFLSITSFFAAQRRASRVRQWRIIKVSCQELSLSFSFRHQEKTESSKAYRHFEELLCLVTISIIAFVLKNIAETLKV